MGNSAIIESARAGTGAGADGRVLVEASSGAHFPSSLLMLAVAFFAPWGAGLQNVARLDLSKLFVAFAVLLVLYWLFFGHPRFRAFPRSFTYFILFLLLHTLIVYGLLHPEELRFGYLGVRETHAEDFVARLEGQGLRILRPILFMLMAYAIAALMKRERQLVGFALAYGAGLYFSTVLGAYAMLRDGDVTQLGGGFLNPNTFGPAAITAVWLNLYVMFIPGGRRWVKILAALLAAAALLALASSISRGSILALCVGFVCLGLYLPQLKKKVRLLLLIAAAAIFVMLKAPDTVREDLAERMDLAQIRERGGTGRLMIWSEYLQRYPRYLLFGVGNGRETVVIEDSMRVKTGKVTHNTYLAKLVEYGLLGLLLFLLGLRQLWRSLTRVEGLRLRDSREAVLLALLASWLVIFMFENTFTSRALWLSLGLIAASASWRATWGESKTPEGQPATGEQSCAKSS